MILTDGHGRPLAKPIAPAPDAPPREFTAYLRALHTYNDRVAACANAAFDAQLRKAIRP